MPSPTSNRSPLSFQFDFPLMPALFLERPNRFVAVVRIETPLGGVDVKAHVPDPGRLKELLIPGVPVLVQDHGPECPRKLRYTLQMVYTETQELVSVNTQLPNRLIRAFLEQQTLPGFEDYRLVKREFTYGGSRIDFLLQNPEEKPCLLEVKSCTLVEAGGQALFPDAPSVRGARHIEELTHALQEGYEAQVLFVIQRSDALQFSPNHRTDPVLARALRQAILAGVGVKAYCFHLSPTACCFIKEIPVVLPEAV